MKHQPLPAFILLVALTSASAAEDSQPALNTSDTARTVSGSAKQSVIQKPLCFLLGAGFTFGGDTVFTANFDDGSTDKVSAGGILQFYGGLDYRLNDVMSLQGTIGYHVDDTKPAENGSVTFSRIPLELLAYYHINDVVRFGAGVRFDNNPRVKGTGVASNASRSFDNAIGTIIEGEYLATRNLGIKVRHVSEQFKSSDSPVAYDGSHFGVLGNFYF